MRLSTTGIRRLKNLLALAAMLAAVPSVHAVPTLTALTSFGGGDGWRAPWEVLPGDTAGTAGDDGYNYLVPAGSLERGIDYNPVTGNLVLVSRPTVGNGIRLLNGTTGVDVGALAQGSGIITGGTFGTNMVAVSDDGVTYVANLQAAADTAAFKVYRWADSAPATLPTTFFNSTVSGYSNGVPRLGDSLDVFGSGASTTLVAGVGPNSGVNLGPTGYTLINAAGTATSVSTFTPPQGITGGDFRIGVTFGATVNEVRGKQISQNAEFTTYSGSAGTGVASVALTAAGEGPMDFAIVQGQPLLAVVDTNFGGGVALPTLRVYDVTDPAVPVLLASGATTTEALPGNPNGVGAVTFGAISGNTATLYALTANQGIQAFTLTLDPIAENSGDYNLNGFVDAADYSVWRDTLGQSVVAGSGADGDNNGLIEVGDYDYWKARFGNTAGSGSGAGAAAAIPEPGSLALLALSSLTCLLCGRTASRRGV